VKIAAVYFTGGFDQTRTMLSEKTARMGDKAKPLAMHGRRLCCIESENTLQARLFHCATCRFFIRVHLLQVLVVIPIAGLSFSKFSAG
jgi:hypothetical protein